MNSKTAQACVLAVALLLPAATAFGFGAKGDGMSGKQDTGMMKEERSMEQQGGTMQKDTMMDTQKTTQDENTKKEKNDRTMMKEEGTGKAGMDSKDTMGTKEMTPMR
jgi:hypothetical protein